MTTMNIHQAKTHLSRLLERVEAREQVVIAKAGKPIARLVPYEAEPPSRKPGYWRGKVTIAKDFDVLPDEVAAAFRGERPRGCCWTRTFCFGGSPIHPASPRGRRR